jgi:RNA polymerase sigma factor (TIGR02999 family)
MESEDRDEITRLLLEWKAGNDAALCKLTPMVEAELRRLAEGYMRDERDEHTLQPTALINEAWMRLAQQNQPAWAGRSHFVAVAACYMRQILVDHARRRNRGKRGSGVAAASLDMAQLSSPERSPDLLALDDGLKELARLDARQSQVVELHFFGGMTYEEIAAHLGIGRSTVIRDLRMAQVWLKSYLTN